MTNIDLVTADRSQTNVISSCFSCAIAFERVITYA